MSNARKLADNLPTEGQLSGRNVVVNGEFAVSQRGTSFTNIGSSGGGTSGYDDTWTMDRFLISQGLSAGRCSVEQSSDTPDGFSKSLKISTTTADTSIGASEYHRLQTKFEGQDLQKFAKGTSSAKEYTLSFYCKANAAATYAVELYDIDNQRTVSKLFNVTTNWTRVILTFPADTTGAFDNNNLLSMELNWWMHTGSTYGGGTLQTTWGGIVQANRAAGIDSIFDSTSRTFFITGCQLEVGSQASPFEHRSFGDELQKCLRYWTKTYDMDVFVGHSGDDYDGSMAQRSISSTSSNQLGEPLPVRMRAMPTVTFYGPTPATNAAGKIRGSGNAVITANLGSNISERIVTVSFTSNQSNSYISAHYTADAEL